MKEKYVLSAELIVDDNQINEVAEKLEKFNSLVREAKTLVNELASVEINVQTVITEEK